MYTPSIPSMSGKGGTADAVGMSDQEAAIVKAVCDPPLSFTVFLRIAELCFCRCK